MHFCARMSAFDPKRTYVFKGSGGRRYNYCAARQAVEAAKPTAGDRGPIHELRGDQLR